MGKQMEKKYIYRKNKSSTKIDLVHRWLQCFWGGPNLGQGSPAVSGQA